MKSVLELGMPKAFYHFKQHFHYENMPIQIYRKFYLQKLTIFR